MAWHNTTEVRMEGRITTSESVTRWNNVHHFWMDDDDTVPDTTDEWVDMLQKLALGVWNWAASHVLTYLSEQLVLDLVRTKVVAGLGTDVAHQTYASSGPAAGSRVADVDEPDDAVVITKRSSLAGKSRTGRVYIPGIGDADQVNGVLVDDADVVSGLHSGHQYLIDTGIAQSPYEWYWGVFSRKLLADAPGTPLFSIAPITVVDLDRVIRRQTRRDIDQRLAVTESTPPS